MWRNNTLWLRMCVVEKGAQGGFCGSWWVVWLGCTTPGSCVHGGVGLVWGCVCKGVPGVSASQGAKACVWLSYPTVDVMRSAQCTCCGQAPVLLGGLAR